MRYLAAFAAATALFCVFIPGPSAADSAAGGAAPAQSVTNALSLPDGCRVSLQGVRVTTVPDNRSRVTVSEPWSTQPCITLLLPAPLDLHAGQTLDVSGVLRTLSDSSRAIAQAEVRGYADATGRLVPFPLPVTGSGDTASQWPWRQDIPPLTATARTAGSSQVRLSDAPAPPGGNPTPATSMAQADGPLGLPDGAVLTLRGRIVTAVFYSPASFYIQEADRSWGLRVRYDGTLPNQGDLVDVQGSMAATGGQRELQATSCTVVDTGYPLPQPLYMRGFNLGGGAYGLYTPAVVDSQGLNNTGLVVRVSGKVNGQTYMGSYWLDDGSGVVDGTHAGVHVLEDPGMPADGDYQDSLTGISGAEVPEGATGSVRALRVPSAYSTAQYGGGSGSITVTVNAPASAEGKQVRVSGAAGMWTGVVTNGSASHTFTNVPFGVHALSATAPTCSTAAGKVTLDSGNPAATLALSLSAAQTHILLTASPFRIPPDGVSETQLTALVYDDEGRAVGNSTVQFTTDLGNLSATTGVTDAHGCARTTLCSTTNHEVATIWASATGATPGGAYVEFAHEGDPRVIVTQPNWNSVVEGFLPITAILLDPTGATPGIARARLIVDGTDNGPYTPVTEVFFDTQPFANGAHILQVAATDFDDNQMLSNRVPFTTDNMFAALQTDKQELMAPSEQAHLSSQTGPAAWQVSIKNHQGEVVYTASGSGPVDLTWGANVPEGIYQAEFVPQVAPASTSDTSRVVLTVQSHLYDAAAVIGGNPDVDFQTSVLEPIGPGALIHWDGVIQEMGAAFDACRNCGLTCALLWRPSWTGADSRIPNRVSLRNLLANGSSSVFFYTSHGAIDMIPSNWTIDTFQRDVTQVHFIDENVDAFHSFIKPERRTYSHAFEDCGLVDSGRLKIIQIAACFSLTDEDTPYAPADPQQPGHTTWIGDVGLALGVGSYSNSVNMDQTYGGFNDEYKPGPFNGGSELHQRWWGWLSSGATASQALGLAGRDAGYPPTFDHWRFYGYPTTTWLY